MADDSNATIIDMLREQTRASEARSDTRHLEMMNAVRDVKTTFEAHEALDAKKFEEIDKWRNRIIGGGIVTMTFLSFAAPVAAHMLGVTG